MNATVVLAAVALFNVGVFAGMLLFAIGTARHSFDVWECTNGDGQTYYLADVAEVEAALAIDGMLAVQRLRVLT